MQDRLSHVRAFINCHIDLLQDPRPLAPLSVTHVVEQLVLQESDSVFDAAPQWTASIERGVVWENKPPVQHACRGHCKRVVQWNLFRIPLTGPDWHVLREMTWWFAML